ncbi:MAG: DUF4350 domain-containing protein [Acidobacteria bacterium]|nr:DUF4350 domain-containing protein [Acidobacteriota bacterium]
MRSRLSIAVFVVVVVALLAALNAASYVQVEREPEMELNPDRSTSNAGPTGTRAIYEYLAASGHKVMRWREPTESLLKGEGASPATFVVVGTVRRHFTEDEKKDLMRWVARGGRLVVFDRLPEQTLTSGERWGVVSEARTFPGSDSRADDVESLVAGTHTLAPTQPTVYATGVERAAPSRYASRLRVVGRGDADDEGDSSKSSDESSDEEDEEGEEPPPRQTTQPTPRANASPRSGASPVVISQTRRGGGVGVGRPEAHPEDRVEPEAPVLNFTDERGALVAEFTRGRGRVVVVADPFLVANNGVARADNLQLDENVLTAGGGLVAFDEYHQGRGETRNQIAAYFAGTPVVAMFGQLILIAAVVAFTRGRRFARPVPAPRVDRRSKLEFVASMAELQQRARAFDLALENIYSRTRRALARYGGTDLAAPREEIASAVSARSGTDRARLSALMRDCEETIAGTPITARRALQLAASLRELERSLGIRMRSREIKQAERL